MAIACIIKYENKEIIDFADFKIKLSLNPTAHTRLSKFQSLEEGLLICGPANKNDFRNGLEIIGVHWPTAYM